jgi:integrase
LFRAEFIKSGHMHWDRYLTIMIGTGLRALELHMARPCDLREDGTWLWVRPESNKKRKGRLVPLRPEVRQALLWQAAAREGGGDTAYYADYHIGSPRTQLARISKRLLFETPMGVHSLRRTFATRCAQAGMYPKHLMMILGHSKIETTMNFYVHLERVSLMDAVLGVSL